MGATFYGVLLSEEQREELKKNLEENPRPHCYFCGTDKVCIAKSDNGPTKVTCLICDRVSFVAHNYNDAL